MNDFPRPAFRRRTYLLTGFQSRFAFAFVVSNVLIAGGTALVLYWFLKRSPREAALFSNLYTELSRSWIFGAALFLLSALTILFIVMVMTLHRVAGPIFVLTRYVNELAAGRYPTMRPLRSKDELTDFFDAFKRMSERLQRREREESRAVRDLLGVLATGSPGPQHQPVIDRLKTVFADKLRAAEQAAQGTPTARVAGPNREASTPRAAEQAAQGAPLARSSADLGREASTSRPAEQPPQGAPLARSSADLGREASTSHAAGRAPPGLLPARSSADLSGEASTSRAAWLAPPGAPLARSSADLGREASTPRAAGQAPQGAPPARSNTDLDRDASTEMPEPTPTSPGGDK
jgi:hypothetical protein